jgi:hypothetical protein
MEELNLNPELHSSCYTSLLQPCQQDAVNVTSLESSVRSVLAPLKLQGLILRYVDTLQ